MRKYELLDQIEKLEIQLDKKELQLEEVISTNSKLTDQLKNLWDEVGCKNDMIREQKFEISNIKIERDNFKRRWQRCIADKYEQKRKDDEKDKAIFEKILNEGRTDN